MHQPSTFSTKIKKCSSIIDRKTVNQTRVCEVRGHFHDTGEQAELVSWCFVLFLLVRLFDYCLPVCADGCILSLPLPLV